jgi:hypothetical protein
MKNSLWVEKSMLATIALLALSACSTGHVPATPSSSPTTHADTAAAHPELSSWSPQMTAGTRRYLIIDSSTVSLSNDTTSRVMPIKSTILYSLSVTNRGDSFALTSQIDSVAISTQLHVKGSPDTGRVSEFHVMVSKQGQLTMNSEQATTTCTGASISAASRISELMISLPTNRLKTGDKWADTASTISCHGKIPLMQHATREYELIDLSSCLQRDAVKVRRTVFDTFTGSSTESNNHLSANGSGTSTSILCLQRNTGALLESNAQSRSDLAVVTTRGTFPFIQNTNTHIELQ